MIRIGFETATGKRIGLQIEPAGSLMEAARAHDVPGIFADCGGSMVCGTCHVVIDPQWHALLPDPCDMEREILDCVPQPQPHTRLSCQIPITPNLDGLIARIPAAQR